MAYTLKGAEPTENQALAEIERKNGPSNFFRMMALDPAGMKQFAGLYETIMGPGSVDRRLKELAYLASSYVNECSYCAKHHEAAALNVGISASEIHNIKMETDQDFATQERVVLRYARELTRTAVTEDDTRTHLQASFSPVQQVEITMVIALANFTNRFNNGLKTPLEK